MIVLSDAMMTPAVIIRVCQILTTKKKGVLVGKNVQKAVPVSNAMTASSVKTPVLMSKKTRILLR